MPPSFYRFSDPLNQLKALEVVPWNGEAIVPAWYDGVTFNFNGSGLSLGAVSGSGIFGYVGAVEDTSGVVSLLRAQAVFTQLGASGGVTNYPAPSGASQTNLFSALTISPNNTPYMTDVSGNIFSFNSSGVVGAFGAFGVPTRGLTVASGSLYALAPASGSLASCLLSSPTATGLVSAPISTLACIASSGALIAVGGWNAFSTTSGFIEIDPSPVNSAFFTGITSGASGFTSWTQNASGIWNLQQHVTNTVSPTHLAWTPLGNTLMATSSGAGTVDIYGLSVNTLSLSQTLSIAGAGAIALAPGSVNGLVCSVTGNLVESIYDNVGTWTSSGTVSLTSPQSVIASPDGVHAYAGYASGLALLTLVGNEWGLTSTTTLSFAPSYLAAAVSGAYAAGVNGSSGLIYSTAAAVSRSFVGGVSGLLLFNNQLLVLDPTGEIRFFDTATLTLQSSFTIASGATAIAGIGNDILISYPTQTLFYQLGAPYQLQSVKNGEVGIYNLGTSGWLTTSTGPDFTPEAVTFDPSGNVTVAMLQNYIFTIAASGGISAQRSVPVFSGQVANTPLGISSLAWIGGRLLATSVLNEALLDVTS